MLRQERFIITRLLVPAFLLLMLAGAGFAQAPPRGTERYEAWLSEEVRHQLVLLPWYSVFDNLQYQVKGSEVVLQGQAILDVTKKEAESRVKGIEGVTKVTNNIELLPASPNDERIRRATYRAIFGDPVLQKYSFGTVQPVHIVVKNGHVTLVGTVLNEGDKQLAEARAKGVSGVFSVTNNLRIENSQTTKKGQS
jgi:hyperosmotically inducible protein